MLRDGWYMHRDGRATWSQQKSKSEIYHVTIHTEWQKRCSPWWHRAIHSMHTRKAMQGAVIHKVAWRTSELTPTHQLTYASEANVPEILLIHSCHFPVLPLRIALIGMPRAERFAGILWLILKTTAISPTFCPLDMHGGNAHPSSFIKHLSRYPLCLHTVLCSSKPS